MLSYGQNSLDIDLDLDRSLYRDSEAIMGEGGIESNSRNVFEKLSVIGAIETAVANNSQLRLARLATAGSRENISVEEGQFDSLLSASASYKSSEDPSPIQDANGGLVDVIGVDGESYLFDSTVQKRLKSSPIVSFGVTSDGAARDFEGRRIDEVGRSALGLSITFPLWQGRGRYLTTLPIELAKLDYEASQRDLYYQVDLLALQTVTDYWRYRGAVDSLGILRETREQSEKTVENVQKLIDLHELPRSELGLVEAQLAQRRSSLLSGEQSVIDAKNALATSMGVILPPTTPEQDNPVDELATPSDAVKKLGGINELELLDSIKEFRDDFLAVTKRLDLAEKQVELAKDATRPDLDLVFAGNVKTYDDEQALFRSATGPTFGPDWEVRLDFLWAPGQTSNKARQRITELSRQQRRYELMELERSTRANLKATIFALQQSQLRYREAQERVSLNQKNLQNERRKVRLNAGTVLDVLNVQDRLLVSELDLIQEQVNYSIVLAQLRFLSGRMTSGEGNSIKLADLQRGEDLFNDVLSVGGQRP
ncbi:TolC family protein [Halioglobus sp. HI00S01]|uniref:TolC family protein n=1 Tax=Halioglobus sp. HI00S01 TaxID=1822214 RepID=UPI0018D3E5FA|nr:TolC family protein [Halioglobus sp. HI00S01]